MGLIARDLNFDDHYVRRPLGSFRFLTPLDTVQAGDLYRYVIETTGRANEFLSTFSMNWAVVPDVIVGQALSDDSALKYCEVIRPIEGTTVPMFETEQSHA